MWRWGRNWKRSGKRWKTIVVFRAGWNNGWRSTSGFASYVRCPKWKAKRSWSSLKKIAAEVRREIEQEIEQLLGRLLRPGQIGLDLEASEMAVRHAMHQIGGVLLEKVINADGGGYGGQEADCEQGHRATFVDYRDKDVLTVLGQVKIERAYYHCGDCGSGVIPKDRELNIVGTRFSPGIRRLMGRVGGKESFQAGRQDLEELAGVRVTAKQVERVAEGIGVEVEAMLVEEMQSLAVVSAQVVPLKVVPKLYIAYDGTGVPVVRRETEGRRGKQENGQAKTRETKLGCVFTQTRVNEQGQPVRDQDSTSYVGAIQTAAEFGPRIYAEAVRRGLLQAQRVIVLGEIGRAHV